MTWVLGIWYLRKADHEFDPLAEVVARPQARETARRQRASFERPDAIAAEVRR